MKKTGHYSYNINKLPKGCQYCVKGSKEVIFITGLCSRACYFCPISDRKYQKDVVYADEWPIKNIREIIKEAKLINAEGAGITGGDPLCKLRRALFCIRRLKKEFGKKFHIHLYTSFDLANEKTLKKLNNAGLDEIRFHADIDNDKLWKKIDLANKFKWGIGIEIPVIPGKSEQTKKLIDYFNDKIDFLNLNELEFADNSFTDLSKFGFKTKNNLSYGIKGSEEMAMELLKYIERKYPKLNVHYCTAKLKDKVQLGNRIKRRAKNIAKPYDIVNKEGILTRGAVYLKELSPGFGYRKKIERANKKNCLRKLNKIKNELIKEYKINKKLIEVDETKLRILIDIGILKKIKTNNKLKKAIVEEYPTYDQLEVNVEFLN